jgi:cytochrome c oxidase subunit 3
VSTTQEELAVSYKAKKFLVWLFVVSSTIMFGGFTSYYLVFEASKGKGHGLVLPDAFVYSTVVLVISSIALVLAKRSLRLQQLGKQRLFLWLTFAFGLAFAYLQFSAAGSLVDTGATFVNNNAAISMIYVLSFLHLVHIVGGLGFITAALVGNYGNVPADKANFRQEIASIFWHFIDILWIYLYVFLLLNR